MLLPTNRLTLIDAMRPPLGYRFDSALAVTYTLDLRALLAAPAAFALTAATEGSSESGAQEPIALLHAVRTYSDKITVFNQYGGIALPPSRRAFAFLENSIVPVRAPRGGVVHPKVWLLRYASAEDSEIDGLHSVMRVLVTSRNLTFDDSWDVVVRFDESHTDDGAALGGIADLFERLSTVSLRNLSDVEQTRVDGLCEDLRSRRFALPTHIDKATVHVLGFGVPEPVFPVVVDRSLVLSPFLSDHFFTSQLSWDPNYLISRSDAIDGIDPSIREKINEVYTFDDGGTIDAALEESIDESSSLGRPLSGLHAKVFAFEQADRTRLFLGSANATGAAFSSNVEILVEMEGPTEEIGIDRLLEGNDDELGLRDLLVSYVAGEQGAEEEASSLDRTRLAIAELAITGTVESSGAEWAVRYLTADPLPHDPDVTISCWPLPSEGSRVTVDAGRPLSVRFETNLEAISGFLAFELLGSDGTMSGFVVPVQLENVPEHRDRALMKSLIGNADRFFRYLLALLDEVSGQDGETQDVVDRLSTDQIEGVEGLPVLEKLLRTVRRDPAKLLGLHPLVVDLANDDILPEGFSELWNLLIEAGMKGVSDD